MSAQDRDALAFAWLDGVPGPELRAAFNLTDRELWAFILRDYVEGVTGG